MTEKMATAAEAVGEALGRLPQESSRRAMLAIGGTAALALLAKRAEAQTQRPPGFEVASSWKSPTNRLVRRVTNGIDVVEQSIASSLGFQGYLNRQLAYESINDAPVSDMGAFERVPLKQVGPAP